MSIITKEIYEQQQAECDNLCVVPVSSIQLENGILPCVRCPFCKVIVTAILTPSTIACPACKVKVNK